VTCPKVFGEDPERYLRESGLTLPCTVDPKRTAIIDSDLRVRLNKELFFFSSRAAMRKFQANPIRYCGKLTDPVTQARFRPTAKSPSTMFRNRTYYFESDSTRGLFVASADSSGGVILRNAR